MGSWRRSSLAWEYLGGVQPAYYDVLAEVGGGFWQPERDSRPWIRFALTAHYHQVQILHRRLKEWQRVWEDLERLATALALPERALPSLFNAAFGARIRNGAYRADADISVDAAGRDLKHCVERGLLVAEGERRHRFYVASEVLRRIRQESRGPRVPLGDPFDSDISGQQSLLTG